MAALFQFGSDDLPVEGVMGRDDERVQGAPRYEAAPIRRQIRSVCFGQRGAGLGVSCRDRGDAALRKSGKAVRPVCGYPTGPNDTDSKCAQWGSLEQRKTPTAWKRWAFSVGEC